jgi:hypothetical protein
MRYRSRCLAAGAFDGAPDRYERSLRPTAWPLSHSARSPHYGRESGANDRRAQANRVGPCVRDGVCRPRLSGNPLTSTIPRLIAENVKKAGLAGAARTIGTGRTVVECPRFDAASTISGACSSGRIGRHLDEARAGSGPDFVNSPVTGQGAGGARPRCRASGRWERYPADPRVDRPQSSGSARPGPWSRD